MSMKPTRITFENPKYGKVEWTLPEHVETALAANASSSAEMEEAVKFLARTTAKVFGTIVYCFTLGKLPDLDAFLGQFAEKGEAKPPPSH